MPTLHSIDPLYITVDGDTAFIELSSRKDSSTHFTAPQSAWRVKSPEHCHTVQILHNVGYNVTIAILHSRLEPGETYKVWMTGDCMSHPEERTGDIKQDNNDNYYFDGLQTCINDFLRSIVVHT